MRTNLATTRPATQGNESAESFHPEQRLETRGNSLSCECLTAAVDHSGIVRKVLAGEVGQSESQFSKSLSGTKGGDFNQVVDRIRPSIRLDYAQRLADLERVGGLEDLAAQDLAHAAIRYLSTRRLPTKVGHTAKAGLQR